MSLKEDREKFSAKKNDKILSFNAIRYSVFKLVMMTSSIAFERRKNSRDLDVFWVREVKKKNTIKNVCRGIKKF